MSIRKNEKSEAVKFMEKVTGGPLTFARLIRAIRLCDEQTLAQFSKRLGISRQHLCDIEKGRKLVSPGRAIRFAKTLGYPDHLFVQLSLQAQLDEAKIPLIVDILAA